MTLAEVGWVLRTARAYAADPDLRVASRFAAGDAVVPPVNPSQVTRWERGTTPPSYDVVRRYETLCGVSPGRLVAAVDLVHRDDEPHRAAPRLRRPMPPDPVASAEPLLERALADEVMTGSDWDRLSLLVGRLDQVLMPPAQWYALLSRGLVEMAVSVGVPYLQRAESMARLAGHPRASEAAHELVRDVLTDADSQVFSEAAALLKHFAHPGAGEMVVASMRSPVSPNALRASLFAVAGLLRDRRLTSDQAVAAVQVALERCRDQTQPYRVRRSAADVLRALSSSARRRIAVELAQRPEQLAVASIVAGDGPLARETASATRARIVDRLTTRLGLGVDDDVQLVDLLDRLSTETNDDRRANALQLLMVLPFGRTVGQAYVGELEASMVADDPTRVHEALGVLMCLAPGDDLRLLLDLAVRDVSAGRDRDQAAIEACWAVGNAKFAPVDAALVTRRVRGAVDDALAGRRAAPPTLLEAWGYVLGRLGTLPPLADTPTDESGRAWRRAHRWWTSLPPHVEVAAREV
ncbi:helix-turn-helix domain-containing protein [Solicola sp. PLA-1-18]|uniref:helix-turn-helix domain-containing protein n=1 Tax=Solicola sp. PLA-1-18 TaxID=3380532 RepID=UPI003B7CA117